MGREKEGDREGETRGRGERGKEGREGRRKKRRDRELEKEKKAP